MITNTHRDEIIDYQKDASNFKGICKEVIIPETKSELIDIVISCYEKNIPFTIAGARTGLGGGSVPLEGIVISTEKLNRILHIDKEGEMAFLQTGVLHADLEDLLDRYGFFFPPNPTEKNSTLGGNVATNASGSRTFKYGATRDYVESLTIILPNGDELHLNRNQNLSNEETITLRSLSNSEYIIPVPKYKTPKVKHSAGYFSAEPLDAIDLFIGSEGTLGIIYEIGLKISKKPEDVFGAVIFFDNYDKMFEFVDKIRDISKNYFNKPIEELKQISARLIEFYDDEALNILRGKNSQIPDNALSAIWIEQEHTSTNLDLLLKLWYDLISDYSSLADSTWMAMNESEHMEFREFRHLLPLTVNEILSRDNMRKFGTDIAVPDKYSKIIFDYLKNEIERSGLRNAMWGHIGNSHFHANVMAKNIYELQKANIFFDNSMSEAIRLGGTISGEHGIGKLKKKYLIQMYGETGIDQMKAIKMALDPKYLLGRGNILDM